jgi:DNA topoisomerase-3
MAYVCEKSVGPQRSCDFRSGRVILQRPIEREQMHKLLSTGRTDLLHRFISKKGRPFSAFLVRGADGKVGFEFAPRVGRSPATAKANAAAENAKKPAAPAKSPAKTTRPRPKTKATTKPARTTRRKSAT